MAIAGVWHYFARTRKTRSDYSDYRGIWTSGVRWCRGDAIADKKGRSQPVIELLNKTISEYIKRPEIASAVYVNGIQPVTGSVEEFKAFIADEKIKWKKVIAEAGVLKVE